MVTDGNVVISPSHPLPPIAVVGSGYWGKNLVRNYHELGALRVICDNDETRLSLFQKQYPEVEVCLAFNTVLELEDVRGVVIATPAETHFTLAREALLAGKHVYIEKPLVLDEGEARELIQLARHHRLILMVGHLLQYHPVFVRLKELVSAGELGRINYIYSHRLNLGKIRREENILWSFAPHDISMILALAAEEPESVFAIGGNYLHRRIADVTTTHLEFPSGLRAHIFVSWLHPFKEQKLVVVGSQKMAVFDDTLAWPDKLLIYPHEIKWQSNIPVPAKAEPERVDIPPSEPLRLECEHFLQCMETGKPPLTDGREGLRVLKVLNASQRSLDSNSHKIGLGAPARMEPAQAPASSPAPGPESVRGSADGAGSIPPFFVHPSAVVEKDVAIGAGTKIWHFSHILPRSSLGERCTVGQNVAIGPGVSIGNGCKIQNNVSVYQGVTLEDDVFCGPSMVFTNVFNPRSHIRRMDELRPTLVKQGASLGANCTIVCGNTVGRYAFVGAGAVVTKNVPDHALVAGNPARQMGWICSCGVKLNERLSCPACKAEYERVPGRGLVLKDPVASPSSAERP